MNLPNTLQFCVTSARRAPKFAVKKKKKEKSVFGQGASQLLLTGASTAPGSRPGSGGDEGSGVVVMKVVV